MTATHDRAGSGTQPTADTHANLDPHDPLAKASTEPAPATDDSPKRQGDKLEHAAREAAKGGSSKQP